MNSIPHRQLRSSESDWAVWLIVACVAAPLLSGCRATTQPKNDVGERVTLHVKEMAERLDLF